MNFKDMTPDERAYYEKIRARSDGTTWILRNLAIFTIGFVIATLIILLS